jgi:DNA-directed RNA polymerase specialized sigma24 family protein
MGKLLIADASAQSPADHCAVVLNSYYLGWSKAQITDDFQIVESTVTSRLHFAMRALRHSLATHPTFSW